MTTPTTTRSERVDSALQSLLERLVPPVQSGEDEARADQRWDEANEAATALLAIDTDGDDAGIAEDVNHTADLIRRKLIREHSRPEQAAAFSNLYSRLLAQPVLTKKWAILYFLLQVSENGTENNHGAQVPRRVSEPSEQEDMQSTSAAGGLYDGRNAVFDDAFARNGLPRFPSALGPETPNPPPSSVVRTRDQPIPSRSRPQQLPNDEPGSPPHQNRRDSGPTEVALLRDLPFTLQGLSSNHLAFADKQSLKLPATLPIPLLSLLHALAEPSLLYRSLADFIESSDGGLVGQSLRSAIELELRSYLGLVATLEGQIRRALALIDENPGPNGFGKAGVTLKRCVVWTREATLGLRLMSAMVEATRGKKGGELIRAIHTFSASHGDPFVHTFAERLLSQVTRPFYHMLRAWIDDGELEDPHQEFFVGENPEHTDSGATSVWEQKYRLREEMIPSTMTADFANRVFLIGKSLNFIRYGCGDSGWVESYSKSVTRELNFADMGELSSSIDAAYTTVMARLMSLMEHKFALFAHLQALKDYLLLGQGDFIALLMESLAANLDRPANSQYRHTLTAQLEHAIRNSNAQHAPADVLRRLDARMLELSHGEIGWDVFTLEYRIDSPLDVIITPWASKQYLKIFNFLWRVRRVEFALATTWRRVQTGARGVLSALPTAQLARDWQLARGRLAAMIHFVAQLQYYILSEVIEAGWARLQTAVRAAAATLDTLISAHAAYLRAITRKGLLGGGSLHLDFTAQLHELLKLMLAYRDAVDGLYGYSVADFTRRQERAAAIETRTRAGRWGLTEADDPDPRTSAHGRTAAGSPTLAPPLLPLSSSSAAAAADGGEQNLLEQLRLRLANLDADFKARVAVLLGDLAYQPDVDMRFLAVVMNFNDVYAAVRRRRQRPPSAVDKEKDKQKDPSDMDGAAGPSAAHED